jgi:hypothetical protein
VRLSAYLDGLSGSGGTQEAMVEVLEPGGTRGYLFSTSTAVANPGAGYLRFDDADPAEATAVILSETDQNGQSTSDLLHGDPSTITVRSKATPANFHTFLLADPYVDNGVWGEWSSGVTYVEGNGTLSEDEEVHVELGRARLGGGGVVVEAGEEAAWRDVELDSDPFSLPVGGDYALRVSVEVPEGAEELVGIAVASTDEPLVLAQLAPDWTPPERPDTGVARYAFANAQDLLEAGTLAEDSATGVVAWHGTTIDPERGSFCLARRGGPFEDLVGERLRITRRDRSVVCYCHDLVELDEEDEDLSLTRRAFAALAPLSTELLEAKVEVLA